MNTFREALPLYHNDNQPLSLGCLGCTDKAQCGGLYTSEALFDCMGFCRCNGTSSDYSQCQFVCRQNVEDYVNRYIEVRGWGFDNIPRSAPLAYSRLPLVVPLLYGSSCRHGVLNAKAVALPLEKLFDHSNGRLKFSRKEDVARSFGFDASAKLLISGVGQDRVIEYYWSHRLAAEIPEQLSLLQPALVTVPNYSLFLGVPREDNLYSMKRIAICWDELVRSEVPASLHVNARTDRDWERWTEFIGERDEVWSIAYEFATGPACQERGKWHAQKLVKLAGEVGRDLQIILRGGYYYLREISQAFSETVFIDTSSYVKTMKRRRLDWTPGEKKHWRSAMTASGEPLDTLLQRNADTFSVMLSTQLQKGQFCLPFIETGLLH